MTKQEAIAEIDERIRQAIIQSQITLMDKGATPEELAAEVKILRAECEVEKARFLAKHNLVGGEEMTTH